MARRKFKIRIEADAEIEIDDVVIDMVDEEWREGLYDLRTPEEIAEHLAYNIFFNRARLSDLDGWVGMNDNLVEVTDEPEWILLAEEIEDGDA